MIYTDNTFRLDATQVITTFRIGASGYSTFRSSTLAIAIIAASSVVAATAWAQAEPASDDSGTSWRESTIARCTQQYSAAQCQDSEFLEENFHVNSLEIAHRTAMHRNQQAQKALRELTLQRVCSVSASDNCANDANAAQCIVQIEQACATLKAEAENCVRNAQSTCASDANPSMCSKNRIALCPSLKKQPIEQLLAKYPRLNAAEKSRLIAAAAEIDAKSTNWWSDLTGWLAAPLSLLKYY